MSFGPYSYHVNAGIVVYFLSGQWGLYSVPGGCLIRELTAEEAMHLLQGGSYEELQERKEVQGPETTNVQRWPTLRKLFDKIRRRNS